MRLRTTVADQPIRLTGSTAFAVQNNALQSENAALRAALRDMRDALKECADDLTYEVEAKYEGMLNYPSMKLKFERDIAIVHTAKSALTRADELLGKE